MIDYLPLLIITLMNAVLTISIFVKFGNSIIFRIFIINTIIQLIFSYLIIQNFISNVALQYLLSFGSEIIILFLLYTMFYLPLTTVSKNKDKLFTTKISELIKIKDLFEIADIELQTKNFNDHEVQLSTKKNEDDINTAKKAIENMMIISEQIYSISLLFERLVDFGDISTNNSIIGETIGIITHLDTCIEKTIDEMQKQSETLQITFEAFDLNNISMERVDKFTQKARVLAEKLGKMADDGSEIVGTAATTMQEINKASENMKGIVDTINNISEKTNLLSMNAAIEAARAGQHGRGFSVVAQEVRKLASNTRKSTEEINSMIQVTRSKIIEGVEMVSKTQTVFKTIVDVIGEINSINEEIYTISKRNLIQGKEILTAVNMLKEVAENIINSSNEELFTTNQVVGAINEIENIVKNIVKLLIKATHQFNF